MNELRPFLDNLWNWHLGLNEFEFYNIKPNSSYEELVKSEWDEEYEIKVRNLISYYLYDNLMWPPNAESNLEQYFKYQNNRLIFGSFRYGKLKNRKTKWLGNIEKPTWKRIDAIEKYLNMYFISGNMEMLIDVSNYCLLEMVEGDADYQNEDSIMFSFIPDFKSLSYILEECLKRYKDYKDKWFLVVIASVCFMLYHAKCHPDSHMFATDEKGLHCDEK